jgi:glutamyl-Q tRNA(Asp) synthetase
MTYKTRFAPSPNGALHLGHAYAAFAVKKRAHEMGGVWLLRHENIDVTRCTPDLVKACETDLRWLGLKWHGQASLQTEALPAHQAALKSLECMGLLYPCFASRNDIQAALENAIQPLKYDPNGTPHYPLLDKYMSEDERAKRIAREEPFALRLDMEKACAKLPELSFVENGSGESVEHIASPQIWGDVILKRKEIPTSYHIAVVVDDANDGITEVVRGRDLFAASHLHRLLQHLLQLPTPAYYHHDLILDETGEKLSKSLGSTGLAALRTAGKSPEDIRAQLGF